MRFVMMILAAILLVGCATSKVGENNWANPAEVRMAAIRAAKKGDWTVVKVDEPRRQKDQWRVYVTRVHDRSQIAETVEVEVSADAKKATAWPAVNPSVNSSLQKAMPKSRWRN